MFAQELSEISSGSEARERRSHRLLVVTTHPIQYQVPWFQRLAKRSDVHLEVAFAMIPDAKEQGREFDVPFTWDMPMLEGYRYRVMHNRARKPSVTRFDGCDTPEIVQLIGSRPWSAVIVNGWGTKTVLQALWGCRRAGIPCIVRGEANGLRPRVWWKRRLHGALVARYGAFLSIGTRNRQYYEQLGVHSDRIFRTPYCIDNEHFAQGARRAIEIQGRGDILAGWDLDPEKPTFLFCGKFVEKKRPGDVIEAVRRLGPSSDVQLLMVGGGSLERELRVAAVGLPVAFAGFLNQGEVVAAYAASDCLVLPSDHGETWGLVVNEAMASGLPAIVSDQVGCAVDLVDGQDTGYTFPCGDVDALADRIAGLAGDEGLRRAMGARARALVFDRFNYDEVVSGTMSALEYLASRRVTA